MILELDHVIVVTDDLDRSARDLAEVAGLTALPGGRHEGHGTGNRIVPLGRDYVELMAVVDAAEAAGSALGRWVAAGAEDGGGPAAVCLRTDDIEAVCDRLGLEAIAMSRRRPDGVVLRWHLAGLEVALGDDRLPFFIQWAVDEADHPGRMPVEHAAPVDGIEAVEVGGPEAALADWLGDPVEGVVPVGGAPGIHRLRPGW